MRFMLIVKATPESEKPGALPDPQGIAAGKTHTVIDGPFAETRELIAGFMTLQVNSLQEAIGWVKRMPNCSAGGECDVEIRQIFEPEDFAANFSEEEIQQEKQIRSQLADRAAKK